MEPVGFVGLGLMGSRMAGRLIETGVPLIVYNRTEEKAEPFAALGARVARTPREVAEGAAVTITMLLDSAAVRAIFKGGEAGQGLLDGCRHGHTHIDMSTVGPVASRELALLAGLSGVRFLDVPVLGSISPAARGELILFVGGEGSDLERCRDLLSRLGRTIIHAGGVGQGNALKVVANMMLARMVEALGEALVLGLRQGLAPEAIHQMLQAGALASPMWDRTAMLIAGDPPVHFPLGHMCKDLRLVSDRARDLAVKLPVHEAVQSLFEEAARQQPAACDYSWLVRWLLERSDVP